MYWLDGGVGGFVYVCEYVGNVYVCVGWGACMFMCGDNVFAYTCVCLNKPVIH